VTGRFTNPVLPGDFSDPDVIRSGADYWMITSTFEYSPGMAVLHSRDLVTWRYAGHCVKDLTALGPDYSADRMGRDGRGIFAGAIREHEGRFLVYFTTLDEGMFMTRAPRPDGPWEPPLRIWDALYWDDPCPFWDDDGRAWMLASRPGEPVDAGWMTYLMPMSWDGRTVDDTAIEILDPTWSSEGNKLYKVDGTYYVLHNESQSHGNRLAVIMRSTSLSGPWEKRTLVRGVGTDRDREPNQGALVQTPVGDWWFITHHGRMGYREGRPVSVLPVRWEHGWPVAGTPTEDGTSGGVMAWEASRPLPEADQVEMTLSDDFTSCALGAQWEWRYQPPPGSWSMDAAGLRLEAVAPLREGDPCTARAALTQRMVGRAAQLTVRVDVTGSTVGTQFTFGHLGGHVSAIQVAYEPTGRCVQVIAGHAGEPIGVECSEPLDADVTLVELRSEIDDDGYAAYAFRPVSAINAESPPAEFRPLGESYPLSMSRYRGNRVLLQCTAAASHGADPVGFVRISDFRYDRRPPGRPR
jgi:beta-xylosidase